MTKPATPSPHGEGFPYLLAILLLSIVTGCSSSPARPVCYPLTGNVTFNKQACGDAIVTLHPKNGTINPLPSGITDEAGNFSITTWATSDGAPAGDYIVTISWKALVLKGEEKIRSGREQLGPQHSNLQKSTWKVTITEGDNARLVLDIKQ